MNTPNPGLVPISHEDLTHSRSRSAFRAMKILIGSYLGVSVLTLIAIIVLRNDPSIVNIAVWIRGTIVAATSVLLFSFAVRATRGSRSAFLRVRIVSAILLVAVVVIIFLPGTFPLWMKIEQAVCGLFLAGVVVVVNGRHLRSLFASH